MTPRESGRHVALIYDAKHPYDINVMSGVAAYLRAREAGKGLATLAVDTEIRFRSAAERADFTSELTGAITKLVSKYHDESAPGGRAHRVVLVAHPLPQASKTKEKPCP